MLCHKHWNWKHFNFTTKEDYANNLEMKEIYRKLWDENYSKIQENSLKTDKRIDNRKGLTLRFKPSHSVIKNITEFTSEAHLTEPEQYYYPISDIHLTILTIITCQPEFSLNEVQVAEYHGIINEVIAYTSSIELTFSGITLSPAAVLVQGVNENGQLNIRRCIKCNAVVLN